MEYPDARAVVLSCANSGSAADWEEFRRRFEPRLSQGVRKAFRRAGGRPRREQLEDLVQESYCRLLERDGAALRRCEGDSEQAVGTYLCRVAERVAIDYLRARAAAKRGRGRVESLDAVVERQGEAVGPAVEARAEVGLIGREHLEQFLSCCRRVAGRSKERNLQIIRLALVDGLSSREICARIGHMITPTGVDTLLHRARARLAAEGILVARRSPVKAV